VLARIAQQAEDGSGPNESSFHNRQHVMVDPVQQNSSFRFLRELPSELAERLLTQFCDEKSLSTLALALSSELGEHHQGCYDALVYGTVPRIARQRLLEQATLLLGDVSNGEKSACAGIVKWIRAVAVVDDSVHTHSSKSADGDEEQKKQEESSSPSTDDETKKKSLPRFPCLSEDSGDHFDEIERGKALAEKLRQSTPYRKLKAMRRLSENLAVSHLLRQGIQQSAAGHWEWTIWVGQITICYNCDATCIRKTVRTAITAPLQHAPNRHILPGASLLHTHRTPTAQFRLEPYNLVRPIPPWGRVRGLAAQDQALLRDVAGTLNQRGGGTICVPAASAAERQRDPLDLRILSPQQASSRLRALDGNNNNAATPRRRLTTEWIVTDEIPVDAPLVCCWHDDSDETDEDERGYVAYVIQLLQAQERLLAQAADEERKGAR